MTKGGKFIKGAANKQLAYSLQTIKTIEDADKALIEDLKPFQLIVDRKIKIKLNQNLIISMIGDVHIILPDKVFH